MSDRTHAASMSHDGTGFQHREDIVLFSRLFNLKMSLAGFSGRPCETGSMSHYLLGVLNCLVHWLDHFGNEWRERVMSSGHTLG